MADIHNRWRKAAFYGLVVALCTLYPMISTDQPWYITAKMFMIVWIGGALVFRAVIFYTRD